MLNMAQSERCQKEGTKQVTFPRVPYGTVLVAIDPEEDIHHTPFSGYHCLYQCPIYLTADVYHHSTVLYTLYI
jgi:hypothetical protein